MSVFHTTCNVIHTRHTPVYTNSTTLHTQCAFFTPHAILFTRDTSPFTRTPIDIQYQCFTPHAMSFTPDIHPFTPHAISFTPNTHSFTPTTIHTYCQCFTRKHTSICKIHTKTHTIHTEIIICTQQGAHGGTSTQLTYYASNVQDIVRWCFDHPLSALLRAR
jgi:hypothetical protein